MSAESLAESYIRQNHAWQKLPANVKQSCGNSQREYEKAVISFSVKNQLRYKGNLVKSVRKDEPRYYEEVLHYSREHLMLYPYHLSDIMVKGLRMTPFSYYNTMMQDIMSQEKSYDSLPNFTAADCLRLLGIGRNQYIDLMNQCRSSKKFFRKRPVKELLPSQPIETVAIESWWVVQVGYVTDDDIRSCTEVEKKTIDSIIDSGPQVAGEMDKGVVHGLYRKGLIYLEVPIGDDDCISVPPLEGFVMNRVLGDYFETLLYKIFVSIDEHTPVAELASVLQIDLPLVKNAVSMYCRLGFAKKKFAEVDMPELHPSWNVHDSPTIGAEPKVNQERTLLIDLSSSVHLDAGGESNKTGLDSPQNEVSSSNLDTSLDLNSQTPGQTKRIAFLFDSTLTAFLMMGNLSLGLKSHAVTMFEVGKLSDESMDSFLSELEKTLPSSYGKIFMPDLFLEATEHGLESCEKNIGRREGMVGSDAEGEARRYFDHALTLRDTIRFLRHNRELADEVEGSQVGQGIDLLRCESLLSLDPETRSRVLNKNYSLLVSMAPLSKEIRPVSSCVPQHVGPAIPEVSSVWFKLFVYHLTNSGPPSLLLMKGTKLRRLPPVFKNYDRLLVTTWGHDPGVIASSNILLTLNDALSHSAVFVQGHGMQSEGLTVHIPFPFEQAQGSFCDGYHQCHSAISKLRELLDLTHTCGYVTLLNPHREDRSEDIEGEDFNSPLAADLGNTAPESEPATNSTNSNNISSLLSLNNMGESSPGLAASEQSVAHDILMPHNGIKDRQSAQDLEKELDSLETNNTHALLDLGSSALKSNFCLDVQGSHTAITKETKAKSPELLKEEEWLLLDLCFGLPLFNTNLNKEVCSRISNLGLFKQESLQELSQSSRTLSLLLMDFIMGWQVQSIVSEVDSNGVPQHRDEHCSLLPSQNILFDGTSVRVWSRH